MYDAPTSLPRDLERQIADDYRCGRLSPWRCDDGAAVRRADTVRDQPSVLRPAFVRDTEKIMNLPAYNRYSGKTQVFSFRQNDDISRRGLHVQLVARVARDIARPLGLNLDLVEAIALGHDIGHTPFGHAGERCLDEVYRAHTGRRFAHNVHSVEVMDRIYGRNVSLQTLDGALCHNGEYEQRVFRTSGLSTFGQLDAQVDACLRVGDAHIRTLVPSTLEGCVVRVADIVAYVGKDRQDAQVAGIVGPDDEFQTGAVGAYNSWVLSALVADIVASSYGKDRIEMSAQAFEELKAAKAENYRVIYNSAEVGGECESTIRPMFALMYDRLLEDLASGDESSPVFRHHVRPVCVQAGYYGHEYDWESDPHRCVCDFIASMTDDYFVALYELLFPNDTNALPKRGYFD